MEREEPAVLDERELGRLRPRCPLTVLAQCPDLLELLLADQLEAQLVEMAQPPGRGLARVPDGCRAPDQLVAPRALDPVYAEERPPDTHGVGRRPGPRRAVLRGHQPVSGVERPGDWCPHIDVAEAEHEMRGARDDPADRRLVGQAVDAP